jgi:hypothetical protein
MKRVDLSRFVVDRDYSVWPIDFAFSASFELPIERLQSALPARIHALEARPGVGLLNLAVFSFVAGAGGLTSACVEIVVSAHVIPNLALAPALPRLSMYTFSLAATTREFIESDVATDRYPVFADPVDVRIDRERIAVEVHDAHGAPILSLAAADGITPRYDDDRFYVQSSTARDGQVYLAGNLFEFRRAENQRRLESGGAPQPHPFFGALDVSGVTARHCHVQMWSEPGSIGCENHFFLRPYE